MEKKNIVPIVSSLNSNLDQDFRKLYIREAANGAALKNSAKITGKHLCQNLFFMFLKLKSRKTFYAIL